MANVIVRYRGILVTHHSSSCPRSLRPARIVSPNPPQPPALLPPQQARQRDDVHGASDIAESFLSPPIRRSVILNQFVQTARGGCVGRNRGKLNSAQAATSPTTGLGPAATYRDLLEPIPNALNCGFYRAAMEWKFPIGRPCGSCFLGTISMFVG